MNLQCHLHARVTSHILKQKCLKRVTPLNRVSRTILVLRPHLPIIDSNYNFEHLCTKLLELLPHIGLDS